MLFTFSAMDTTALTAQIDALETQIGAEQTQLDSDQTKLKELQAELSQANLINSIEALNTDEVSAINAALEADGSHISLSLPPEV